MTAKDKEAFLKNKLFSSLNINGFKDEMEIISAKKGETVMAENSFRRCLVLIIRGRASVIKTGLEGRKTIINSLSEGDVFGMASLFYEQEEFPSEIVAEKDLRLAVLRKESVEKAILENPDFAKAYITLLSEKIHFLNQKLSAFSESDASEKLFRWILSTAGEKEEFELSCSISKLSSTLGIGRASVYRAFESLEEKKKIAKSGKKIVILRP